MSKDSAEVGSSSLSAKGHVFAMECTTETVWSADLIRRNGMVPSTKPSIQLDLTTQFALQVFNGAASFYKLPEVEMPGFVLLSLGLYDVLDAQMIEQQDPYDSDAGKRFIDEEFEAEVTIPAHDFLRDPARAAQSLFEDLKFGFDL